jgi:hypothetical protein
MVLQLRAVQAASSYCQLLLKLSQTQCKAGSLAASPVLLPDLLHLLLLLLLQAHTHDQQMQAKHQYLQELLFQLLLLLLLPLAVPGPTSSTCKLAQLAAPSTAQTVQSHPQHQCANFCCHCAPAVTPQSTTD